ncbi:MAG TPA: D-glycero-beta-D-manno-heptose 1,7-bisphosphate 7-phosphatase [Aquabacterium sp.]|nr:D-glycero-beta-D-manno-heptose 1,7-bisphosphate 7-phosphatase [Aquabacterium sp.]
MDKVCAREDAAQRVAALPKPVVFTNGVFDVLHRGHVNYLHEARALGGSLVVAVNSDASARMLGKGPDRPLNKAEDRAAVLAGLASVSLVTFFDERTPVELIKEVRPDLYVKGGDYDMETLEETRVVRSWGGDAVAISFVDGYSTTSLVKRIRAGESAGRKAAFLDRDGVINLDRAYVHRWDEFEFVPGAVEAMRRLREAGYTLVVVTNQSGLARGMYTEAQYQALTAQMRQVLAEAGAEVAGVYHCPHHPKGKVPELAVDCDCRKPEPGMILQAAQDLGLSLADSIMVGDKPSDIQAARAAGVGKAYIVQSDNDESTDDLAGADAAYADLRSCVDALLPG